MLPEIPLAPPENWFAPPASGIPTDKRITIDPDGRVYGYIALRGSCHVGMKGCVEAPLGESKSEYEFAHQGETLTADGSMVRTAVIPGGIAHAKHGLNAEEAGDVYANTGQQLMRVRYGEDDAGLWFAGALFPDVSELDVARIRASSISGDWRWQTGWREADTGIEFVGSCLVNIPGLPIPARGSELVATGNGRPLAMVASYFDGVSLVLTASDDQSGDDTTTDTEPAATEVVTETEAVAHEGCSCASATEPEPEPTVEERMAKLEETVASIAEPITELHAGYMSDKRKAKAKKLFATFND